MPRKRRRSGVTVEYPKGYRPPERGAAGGTRGGPAARAQSRAVRKSVEMLTATMEVVDVFDLPQPTGATARSRAADGYPASEPIRISVDVEAGEQALILTERAGVYRWHTKVTSAPEGRSRTVVEDEEGPQVELEVELPKLTRRETRGLLGEVAGFALAPAKAFVLKFAAGATASGAMKFLERNVRPGLLQLAPRARNKWKPIDNLSSLTVPRDRPPRILLFLHGTFSNTANSFAGLAAKGAGKQFLADAHRHYDAVIGYDHHTLSKDPVENAQDLLRRLKTLKSEHPPEFDGVAYSRGGLVLRSLIERLSPDSGWEFDRAIFVACPHQGTQLAQPENWNHLLNRYTNLGMVAARAMGLFPGMALASTFLAPLFDNLREFAEYLVSTAVEDRFVPGLAAMEPGGDFMTDLNDDRPGRAWGRTRYYTVCSDFERKLLQKVRPGKLANHLKRVLADFASDQLMKTKNDLVVDLASMVARGVNLDGRKKGKHDFGTNGAVHHTNYFTEPTTVAFLRKCLSLDVAESASERRRARRSRGIGSRGRRGRSSTQRHSPHSKISVSVQWGDITAAKEQVLCVGHYQGVMPQVAELALDKLISNQTEGTPDPQRLILTQQTRRGVLVGKQGDVDLFPIPRQPGRFVAVCGMGYQSEFGELALKSVYRNMIIELSMLPDVESAATVLIGGGKGGLGVERVVDQMVAGFQEASRALEGKAGINHVRIVEFERFKAEQLLKHLLTHRTRTLNIRPKLAEANGKYDRRFVRVKLFEGAKAAVDGPHRSALKTLLQLGIAESSQGLDDSLDALVDKVADLKSEAAKNRKEQTLPSRISFTHDDRLLHVAAITGNSTVPERLSGLDPKLIAEAARRTTEAAKQRNRSTVAEVEELSDDLRRLLWPREFLRLLDRGSAPLIFEVDRRTAMVHWEMTQMVEDKPVAVERQVARQIRTTYSPPPRPEPQRQRQLRALVIGDPSRDHPLPGARHEAREVARFLRRRKFVDVVFLLGAPGDEDDDDGVRRDGTASRFDVLRHLNRGTFDLVHYCGHGDFDPIDGSRKGWVFQDGLLTASEVQSMERPPALMVANACLSALTSRTNAAKEAELLPSLADEFFRRGVRDYIGTAWEVNDEGAVLFAKTFYTNFLPVDPRDGQSLSIGDSMLKARSKLFRASEDYHALWAAYQHYGDPTLKIDDIIDLKD